MKIKCTFHIAIAFILIQLTDEFSIAFAYGICEKNPYVRILYVTFAILSLLTMIYLYTKYIIRIQMQDLFLGMPLPKKKWCITAVLMPVLICLFYIFFTKGTFEKGNLTYKEIIDVVTISILSSGIKAAVTEEIVFRGMILRLLQNTFGKKCAVFVSSFLFAVYHFDGIDTSDIKKVIMMIISVEIAGIALALVTEQTGSIWSSVMIHCLYNILSGESQIFHIDVAQNFPAIWMYTVNSKNMLLTGINGSVGFTASIPTMAGFTGIILMVIYDEKKKKNSNTCLYYFSGCDFCFSVLSDQRRKSHLYGRRLPDLCLHAESRADDQERGNRRANLLRTVCECYSSCCASDFLQNQSEPVSGSMEGKIK